VEHTVYLIGHPLRRSPLGDAHNEAFSAGQLPIRFERLDVPPVNFHRTITELLREDGFLGAKISVPYKQTALAYCQELSLTAQGIGSVNTLVRRPSGLVYGHNTDVAAFTQYLREQGVERARTALILGAGGAARVALAGLRDLGCARYLVGYRHPRRPPELSSQFKGIRRQIDYFPLQEMQDFLNWTALRGMFHDSPAMPSPLEQPSAGGGDDGLKRWDILVNATPVGQQPYEQQSPVGCPNFLRCFERVLDMVPVSQTTPLVELAEQAGVPALLGLALFQLQASYSRELWVREYQRRQQGKSTAGRSAREPILKRQKR
jgi:shikimate 5-dehydrogenase